MINLKHFKNILLFYFTLFKTRNLDYNVYKEQFCTFIHNRNCCYSKKKKKKTMPCATEEEEGKYSVLRQHSLAE